MICFTDFDFDWSLRFERAIREMSAVFANNLAKTHSCDIFKEVFDVKECAADAIGNSGIAKISAIGLSYVFLFKLGRRNRN